MEKQWFVLHTLTGQEFNVRESIRRRVKQEEMEDLVGEVIIPTEEVSEVKKGVKSTSTRKFFPGAPDLAVEILGPMLPQVSGGALRVLAVSAEHRHPALPVARGQQAPRRIRAQVERTRLQGDRREAGEVLLPDRRAASRGLQPVPTGPRQDRSVQQGVRRS